MLRNVFLLNVLKKIENELPQFVYKSIYKTTPISIILSLLEVMSLSLLLPVINLIFNKELLFKNYYLSIIYHKLNFTNEMSFILFLLFSVLCAFIIKNIAVYYISKYQTTTFFNIASSLVDYRYSAYMRMPYIKHIDSNSSALLRNVAQIPFEFTIGVLVPLNAIISELIIISIIALSIFIYNAKLLLLLAVIIFPLVYFYNRFHKKTLEKISTERDLECVKLYKEVSQSFEGIREYIVFDKTNFFKESIKKTANNFSLLGSQSYLISFFSPKIVELVAVFALLTVYASGYILNYPMSQIASLLILYAIALYRIIPSINRVLMSLNNIRVANYTFDYLKDTIELEESSDDLVNNEPPLAFKSVLKIENLNYKYPGKEHLVLNNVNINIYKGQKIGIIGPSGSGKSTFLNILLKLFVEDSGGIYVDDTLLTKDNVKSWYKLVGYVPQNIVILDGTLLENIAFGLDVNFVDKEFLNTVIEKAQLTEFLNNLPKGLDTQLGEKGLKISGGQKQRIGIARALFHKAQILIFDEATSSLDYETEDLLTESINSISEKNLTIIIVAHRLQTLKYCDLVFQLKNGILNSKGVKYEEIIKY